MSESIKDILIRRDGLSPEEADRDIAEARAELNRRLEEGGCPDDICQEFFGIEPDYIFDLLEGV